MATTQNTIRTWLKRAKPEHTHMIVACDTFDYNDYPVFVSGSRALRTKIFQLTRAPMSRIMEVYDLSMDLEEQLNETRAWHV